jgi:hypothetical protein
MYELEVSVVCEETNFLISLWDLFFWFITFKYQIKVFAYTTWYVQCTMHPLSSTNYFFLCTEADFLDEIQTKV